MCVCIIISIIGIILFYFFCFFQIITETGEHWYITEEKSDLESNKSRRGNILAPQRNPVGSPFLEEKKEVDR